MFKTILLIILLTTQPVHSNYTQATIYPENIEHCVSVQFNHESTAFKDANCDSKLVEQYLKDLHPNRK